MKIIEPIVTFLVLLPSGYPVACENLHSAEKLCDYLNGLNAPTEPVKDDPDEHYDRVVGNLVRQMPGGSSLTRNYSNGWKYHDANGAEYGPYVNVLKALEVLSKP